MDIDKFQDGDITYYRIFASCPVCSDSGRSTPRTFWTHGDNACNGEMYVGDNAKFKCKKCGSTAHANNWIFGCSVCNGSAESVLKVGRAELDCSISLAGQMLNECGLPWLQRFLTNFANEEE